jgi:lipid II:glycine glycyltransferase (peptidoglycan interpeptide bridge formation enzyme)
MNTWHTTSTDEWRAFQAAHQAHFLQSEAWAAFQSALDRRIFFANGKGWSWLAILEPSRFGMRLYCPYGPTAKNAKALEQAIVALKDCAAAQNALFIRVEPQGPFDDNAFRSLGLRPAHRNIQPRYTLIKQLDKPEDELLAEMTATNRNLHRTAANKGLAFQSSSDPQDVSIFLAMMHEVAGRNNITIHRDDYYKTMAQTLMPLDALRLFIANLHHKPVAASLVFDNKHTRYYAHAASHAEARKLHPGTPLVSHMIFDAKKSGKQAFDFYGIAPPDQPNHPWAGFTKFKQSFGGEVVDRHGTWELSVKKIPYTLYRLLAKAAEK